MDFTGGGRERRENLVADWGFILNGHSSTRRSCTAVMTTRSTLADKFRVNGKERMKGTGSEPVGGGGGGGGGSGGGSIPGFGCLSYSKVLVYWHCLVTLPLAVIETLKWLSSLHY